jgi:hypothetical protein
LLGEYKGRHLVTGETLTERAYYKLIARHSPRDHWIPTVPKARIWLPVALNTAAAVGLLPERDYKASLASKPGEPLPTDLEETSPVSHRGTETAVADAIDWYRSAGVI